jgi:hypothetical protein
MRVHTLKLKDEESAKQSFERSLAKRLVCTRVRIRRARDGLSDQHAKQHQGPFMYQNCRLLGRKSRLASVIQGVGTTDKGGWDH